MQTIFIRNLIFFLFLSSLLMAQEKKSTAQNSETVILMAMHGGIPADFPKYDLGRFFQLHGKPKQSLNDQEKVDLEILDDELRNWPRSAANDPYYAGCVELQQALEKNLSLPVLLAFNEYCAPSIEDAIVECSASGTIKNIIVVTTMTTTGGSHSEKDIPAAISRAQKELQNKDINIEYRWPVPLDMTVKFMTDVVNLKLNGMETYSASNGGITPVK